ncbi:MAG: hypothetical protein ACRDU4_01680 [Mycobacterium sp.]
MEDRRPGPVQRGDVAAEVRVGLPIGVAELIRRFPRRAPRSPVGSPNHRHTVRALIPNPPAANRTCPAVNCPAPRNWRSRTTAASRCSRLTRGGMTILPNPSPRPDTLDTHR